MQRATIIRTITTLAMACALEACIPTGLKITEVLPDPDKAILIGSINHHGGAEITTYVVEIDGAKVVVKKGFRNEYKHVSFLDAGSHEITVLAQQCRSATKTFQVNLEVGKIYVAQAIP